MHYRLPVAVAVVAACGLLTCASFAAPPAKGPTAAPESSPAPSTAPSAEIDRLLGEENAKQTSKLVAPLVDDLAYLRRVTIDLLGRIPKAEEIAEFQALPVRDRRAQVVEKLLADARFADRWTVFYADMLRIRSGAEGGSALIAFVHQSIEKGVPYDAMCRQLISTNGKANYNPEVGFILGDAADPMALAGATAQTFMGIRIACAQCHNHPFDVWTREQFYGLAAYYGLTRRVERRFKNTLYSIYTTDSDKMAVLWPPEGVAAADQRKPMKPVFPFVLAEGDGPSQHIARLESLRQAQDEQNNASAKKSAEVSLDDLLAVAEKNAQKRTDAADGPEDAVLGEARKDAQSIQSQQDLFRRSKLRHELSELITSPRNRFFARAFVNRVWAELLGRGFVEPVDDFSADNLPSHPKTLDFIADEFVASGYDLRSLVRLIANTDVYRRSRLKDVDLPSRKEAEAAFASAPVRRMMSEVLYDSIVLAGHLFDVKHEAGKNLKTEWVLTEIPKAAPGAKGTGLLGDRGLLAGKGTTAMAANMAGAGAKPKARDAQGYSLESAIELDFNAVLNAKAADEPEVEQMEMVSKEQLEAEEELKKMTRRRGVSYIDRFVKTIVDDNPRFASAMRMASPTAPSHFLRVFGQPPRDALGQFRDQSASMRQALMILNGRLTNEASRVGDLEPVYPLLAGDKPDLTKAIQLVYLDIFTRAPNAEELAEGKEIIKASTDPLQGMADLRWALLNSHEFRYLP